MRSIWSRYRKLGLPGRLALATGVFVVVGAGTAVVAILLLGQPRVSLSSGGVLARVQVSGLDVKLVSLRATTDGRRLALVHEDGGVVPQTLLDQGQTVQVTATAAPPSWLRWLLGSGVSTTRTLRTPAAASSASLVLTSMPGEVQVSFDRPVSVVEYRLPGRNPEVVHLAHPARVAELAVPSDVLAGSLDVAASPRRWERVTSPLRPLTWFVAETRNEPMAFADPSPGSADAAINSTIHLTFDEPVAKALDGAGPKLSPSVAGTWSTPASNELVFTPRGFGFGPGTAVTINFPRPVSLLATTRAATTATATTSTAATTAIETAYQFTTVTSYHFTTVAGSMLRLEQILAQLQYLPLDFVPAAGQAVPTTFAAEVASMSDPLQGSFTWRWASTPAALRAQWVQGEPNVTVKGALMAFESVEGTYDGYEVDDETVAQIADASTWKALLEAAASNQLDPNPYSYVYVTQTLPETLAVWENGSVVLTSPTNTGIPESPTADGTFPIYVRFSFNYMSGFNPDGSYYDDPVYWINYFNGGDAVHGFVRASYGFPQSLGCVELPTPTAEDAFNHLAIGDLVTVAG
jgi:lipoprotein-anchoring transpeptidase ErfK/SrfK